MLYRQNKELKNNYYGVELMSYIGCWSEVHQIGLSIISSVFVASIYWFIYYIDDGAVPELYRGRKRKNICHSKSILSIFGRFPSYFIRELLIMGMASFWCVGAFLDEDDGSCLERLPCGLRLVLGSRAQLTLSLSGRPPDMLGYGDSALVQLRCLRFVSEASNKF